MTYHVLIEQRVVKSLAKIPEKDQERIMSELLKLEKNPRPIGSKKLIGRNGWRIRIGNYRVIYEIDDKVFKILVIDAGHRKDIYR